MTHTEIIRNTLNEIVSTGESKFHDMLSYVEANAGVSERENFKAFLRSACIAYAKGKVPPSKSKWGIMNDLEEGTVFGYNICRQAILDSIEADEKQFNQKYET